MKHTNPPNFSYKPSAIPDVPLQSFPVTQTYHAPVYTGNQGFVGLTGATADDFTAKNYNRATVESMAIQKILDGNVALTYQQAKEKLHTLGKFDDEYNKNANADGTLSANNLGPVLSETSLRCTLEHGVGQAFKNFNPSPTPGSQNQSFNNL